MQVVLHHQDAAAALLADRLHRRAELGRLALVHPRRRLVDGGKTPERQLRNVVFPDPFGPIRPTTSPSRRRRDTSRSAWTPPKRLLTSTASSRALTRASLRRATQYSRSRPACPAWRGRRSGAWRRRSALRGASEHGGRASRRARRRTPAPARGR